MTLLPSPDSDSKDYVFSNGLELSREALTAPFKYNEGKLVGEVLDYVASTYGSYYARDPNKTQAIDLIEASGNLPGFASGSILKYATRLGKKSGTTRRSDLMKIIHYALLLLNFNEESSKT